MTTPTRSRWQSPRMILLVALIAMFATAAIAALLINILERKEEAKNPFYRVVTLTDTTEDPAVWGENFPLQYDSYLRIMWAGYAFSVDYRKKRGHAYMLEDQIYTERQNFVKQPGTCLNCHASMYTVYKRLGHGDLVKGFDSVNRMPYAEALKQAKHPVACIDCHNPTTMQLRITRPAFMEGIRVAKAAQGIANYDVNTMASRQEMRAYVCGQCHVEYYFKGPEKRLTYPWAKGLLVDSIMAYYNEIGFSDWTHKETGAPLVKAQHPEFETWSQGIHARSGVMCADCHMPYTRVGALKITDHHVQSPLLNINNACQTCHKFSESELLARAELIQDRTFQLRNIAMDALMDLIRDIKAARDAGASDAQLKPAWEFQRRAQFYIDFVESENSIGFHAPQETAKVLGTAIDQCRKGQEAVRNIRSS